MGDRRSHKHGFVVAVGISPLHHLDNVLGNAMRLGVSRNIAVSANLPAVAIGVNVHKHSLNEVGKGQVEMDLPTLVICWSGQALHLSAADGFPLAGRVNNKNRLAHPRKAQASGLGSFRVLMNLSYHNCYKFVAKMLVICNKHGDAIGVSCKIAAN
jgi:hypothetical protein